jgi:hypothetical protein
MHTGHLLKEVTRWCNLRLVAHVGAHQLHIGRGENRCAGGALSQLRPTQNGDPFDFHPHDEMRHLRRRRRIHRKSAGMKKPRMSNRTKNSLSQTLRTYRLTPVDGQGPIEGMTDFLRHLPNGVKDGVDLATGEETPQVLSALFGEWDPVGTLRCFEGDADLAGLQSLHALAIEHYRDMLDTLARVRDDKDPGLNAESRLKIAVCTIEPNLNALAKYAGEVLSSVNEAISREEEEVANVVRRVDPRDAAIHADIRFHIKGLGGSGAAAAVCAAISEGDLQTLQAVASAPAYLSGLGVEGKPISAYKAAQRLLQRKLAPQHCSRAEALRAGRTVALQALSVLDIKAHRFLDFKRAKRC